MPQKIVDNTDSLNSLDSLVKYILVHIDDKKDNYVLILLEKIYNKIILPYRELNDYEKNILSEANKLILLRYRGLKFSEIVKMKYKYSKTGNNNHKNGYIVKYGNLPNSKIQFPVSLFSDNDIANFDEVLFNTYDFFDKLIDLKLIDIYYMVFTKYYEKTNDDKANLVATKMKYGTIDSKEIMEIRYGFNSEDFLWLNNIVDQIDEYEIKFNENVNYLDEFKREKIKRYI